MVSHATKQPRWEWLAGGISRAKRGKQVIDIDDESQHAASRRPLHTIMTIRDRLLGYACATGSKGTAQSESFLARRSVMILRGDLTPWVYPKRLVSSSLCTCSASKHYC